MVILGSHFYYLQTYYAIQSLKKLHNPRMFLGSNMNHLANRGKMVQVGLPCIEWPRLFIKSLHLDTIYPMTSHVASRSCLGFDVQTCKPLRSHGPVTGMKLLQCQHMPSISSVWWSTKCLWCPHLNLVHLCPWLWSTMPSSESSYAFARSCVTC